MALSQREIIHALKINRIAEQVAGTLDQNVRRAMQEQAKVLDTALQSHLRVLQAAVLNIPKQWIRVDIPPPMPKIDLAPPASFTESIRKALSPINYADTSIINLSAFTQPPHNRLVAFSPYTGSPFGGNSQYPDNEEEPPDSATGGKSSVDHSEWRGVLFTIYDGRTTDSKLSVEHSEWYQNRLWQLGQDLAQHCWWEPVIWIVLERLS